MSSLVEHVDLCPVGHAGNKPTVNEIPNRLVKVLQYRVPGESKGRVLCAIEGGCDFRSCDAGNRSRPRGLSYRSRVGNIGFLLAAHMPRGLDVRAFCGIRAVCAL